MVRSDPVLFMIRFSDVLPGSFWTAGVRKPWLLRFRCWDACSLTLNKNCDKVGVDCKSEVDHLGSAGATIHAWTFHQVVSLCPERRGLRRSGKANLPYGSVGRSISSNVGSPSVPPRPIDQRLAFAFLICNHASSVFVGAPKIPSNSGKLLPSPTFSK